MVSNLMFAVSEIVMYEIKLNQLTYYLYVVFNAIGLYVLLVTLMKIAELQFKYQLDDTISAVQ